MDGFSPPPMSDFSPPPMEDLSPLNDFPPPINGFSPPPVGGVDDADDHFDFDINDTSYDLTGLSEKMNSLEFDKINNLPPREILELKKESCELNNLYSNNLKVESSEQLLTSENNNEKISDNKKHVNGEVEVSLSSNEVYENGAFNADIELEVQEVCFDNPLRLTLSDEIFNNPEPKSVETLKDSVEDDCQSSSSELSNNIELEGSNDGLVEQSEDKCLTTELRCSDENLENKGNVPGEKCQNEELTVTEDSRLTLSEETCTNFKHELENEVDFQVDEDWSAFPQETLEPPGETPWGNFEAEAENDDWGDFDDTVTSLKVVEERTKPSEVGEVREIEFDDCSDDEFGDFGLAEEFDNKSEVIPTKTPELSLSTQLAKLDGVGENLINTVFGGKVKVRGVDEECDSELNLEHDVLGDIQVFQPMENPASTPGLDYKWRDSATYTILLNTLGIDSRVVLDGENWRSSVPRYAPKTAATLLTPGLLTPEPVACPSEKQEDLGQDTKEASSSGVTPAEFDWNKSGLTNPLEENGSQEVKHTETPKVITELLAAQNIQAVADKKSEPILQKHLSREAKNILDGFPLLNFMSSSVLMFPTRSIDKQKRRTKPD